MSQRLAIYDNDAVKKTLLGIPITDGFVSLTVEPAGPAFEDEAGEDGLVVRVATHESRYTATLTLKGASSHIAQLSAIHEADRGAPNGAGVGIFSCVDDNGSTLINSDKCWIAQSPSMTKGRTPEDVAFELRFVAGPGQVLLGGN